MKVGRVASPLLPSRMRAVLVREHGDPSKLLFERDVEVRAPQARECVVKNTFAGLNFIDTYHRSGLYPRELPFVMGTEGAGEVVAIGAEVKDVKVGDRVAYNVNGSYAEFTNVPESKIIPVPSNIPLDVAAGCVVQGLTAHYLTHSTFPVKKGDWVLIHAGAGGTGRLLVQFAKLLGANVITTTSAGKVDLAKACGADVVIDYHSQDVVKQVMEVTNKRGVDVVYDGVGQSTWKSSLDSLKLRGMCVFFGNASGPVPPINPLVLSPKSLFLTRPRLLDYTVTRQELLERSSSVFDYVARGALDVKVAKEFALEDVVEGHKYLEAGKSTGKIVFRVHP
eukprot:c11166_g1_i1.p1 GENE.c11166_g1_i1~~c11166_g1_i1.p1  ORF type:complete len:337 (+),score=64.72 c11166_g1_i1:22-1032(+)